MTALALRNDEHERGQQQQSTDAEQRNGIDDARADRADRAAADLAVRRE
jgi:hypothetical protein